MKIEERKMLLIDKEQLNTQKTECLLYLLTYNWIIVEKDQWHEQKN